MKAVLYCGDRHWKDKVPILESFDREHPTVVIHGAARGADTMAGSIAQVRGIGVEAYPAEWDRYGKGAGPIRNEQMLLRLLALKRMGYEVKVVAFHSDLPRSSGTRNMVNKAREARVEVEVINE